MTLSVQTLEKLQERISDLEGERDLIKENYDSLLKSTLSAQSDNISQAEKHSEVEQRGEKLVENMSKVDIQTLEEALQAEREERRKLELEKEKLKQEKETLEKQRVREEELSVLMRERQEHLEREVVRYSEQASALQDRLDSISKEFDMSIEELSETFLQIKTFRMQQETSDGLQFLVTDSKVEDPTHELINIQASYAETVLELQKTRNLLLLEHKITRDLQEELNTTNQRVERDKEEIRRRMADKDKLLSKRALQINTLQAQLKELAYSPRNYKRTIPIQYTWPAGEQEVVQSSEDDLCFSQLKAGESLLEIHLKAAIFTPTGLRIMNSVHPGADKNEDIVTFCTYCLLDFELHSTPLVSGSHPNYGYTSRYALTARDLGRLGGQGSRVRLELHQALGGVRFVTHGNGHMSLVGAIERTGERIGGSASITGEGCWWSPCCYNLGFSVIRGMLLKSDKGICNFELYDYGGGIPNELVVMLERCIGLNARWPGLHPDSYLTYRLYDLPPHVSLTVQCTSDPVFNDVTSYPLAVTMDVLHYLRSSSLWVYVFDDSDDQTPPTYLAKTPIPLRALASGREIRGASEASRSLGSSSSQSDIVIVPRKMKKRDKLRVEILSLTFEPSSHVALDKSVQRVYVEYRLLGVPLETTETPMSLRKPVAGEEIHYNFTRVIYVDSSQSAPLRHYLYTMLEGMDPNQGRLKFTVVSEPMDDDEECVEVGHAFLDLQELLLTGNDVIEQQIDIVSVDEDKEVIGTLKVSLEAAKVLTGIYQEFHQKDNGKTEDEEEEKKKKTDQIQVLDYEEDGDF
ncbi:protein fantom-like [Nothobranchius furzeri]|uniref:Protein fantom-like n=1 Tax=Nothobranchius furzeri TaxID=105023 RepID=A0A9D3C5K8_NOTFU|nr:protein fantom-like [Nothobranchius furzeri]